MTPDETGVPIEELEGLADKWRGGSEDLLLSIETDLEKCANELEALIEEYNDEC